MKRAIALTALAFVLGGCVTDDFDASPPYGAPPWAYGWGGPSIVERPPVTGFSLSIGSGRHGPPYGRAHGYRRPCQPVYAMDPFWSRGPFPRYRQVGVAC